LQWAERGLTDEACGLCAARRALRQRTASVSARQCRFKRAWH